MDKKTSQGVHTTVPFAYGGGTFSSFRPSKVVFEMDDKKDDDQLEFGAVRIRHYPASMGYVPTGIIVMSPSFRSVADNVNPGNTFGYTYETTEGYAQFTREQRERYVEGSVSLSGGMEVDLPYPAIGDVTLAPDGRLYSDSGDVINPALWFDSYAQKVRVGRPTYGRIRYSFTTSYLIIRYYPNRHYAAEVYYDVNAGDYGQILGFPRVHIPDSGSDVISFQVQPPHAVDGEFEIYRVVSTGIINSKGSWEKPASWPQSGAFPPKTDADAAANPPVPAGNIDTAESFLEVERVHEIGYLRLVDDQVQNFGTSSTVGVSLSSLEGKMDRADPNTQYSLAVGTVTNRIMDEYLKRDTFSRNKASVRSVRYEVPWAMPYDTTLPEFYQVVYVTETNTSKTTITQTLRYKRVVTIKASKPPLEVIGTTSKENINNITYDAQANRINAHMRTLYEKVNWEAIKAAVIAGFNSEFYSVSVDPSFPKPTPRN